MHYTQSIHPFPARMAPEIALAELRTLPSNSLILDPMVGSGTVVRVASEQQHRGIGFDLDPLAVLMSRVWTTPIDVQNFLYVAKKIIEDAERIETSKVLLSWIDDDEETKKFIDYWFGRSQQKDLRVLSSLIQCIDGPIGDALKISLSRIIITKDRGASLARDVSHSRPHRVCTESNYQVITEFQKSVKRVASILGDRLINGSVKIENGDARRLAFVDSSSIDAIITSPPYLNAIDYMRGHKLSLVWLGYRIKELRLIRQESIGAERSPDPDKLQDIVFQIRQDMNSISLLPRREHRMIERYIIDMYEMISELQRVIKPDGKLILVIGNSCIKGVFIDNATAISKIAEKLGFSTTQRRERELPPSQRYLPPPTNEENSSLKNRMRTETVLSLRRS